MKAKQHAISKKEVNCICIKWGILYTPDYVNKLKNMIKRNTSYKVNFYCFTEDPKGLDKDINVYPLPVMHCDPKDNKYAYRKEAGLCDTNLGDLNGKRVFFFDLDTVIVGNLDELFSYPVGDNFYILRDWVNKHRQVGQASLYSFVVGTLGHIKEFFEKNPKEVVAKYKTASQEYLTDMVIKTKGINYWPKNWTASFRFHCMPLGILRHFIAPKIPKWKGLKTIAFHGIPNMHEAIIGSWGEDVWKYGKKYPHGIDSWKKIYKHCKPTPWIKDYWY